MTRIALKYFLALLFILLVGYAFWWSLPIQVKRGSEIEDGIKLVSGLQAYQAKYGALPETGDWEALEEAGFELQEMGTIPEYKKKSDSTYRLTYLEGFDGPYLTYESETKEWTLE